ncbi:MAG: IclR family transcriptional regulator [Trebonia sp.]
MPADGAINRTLRVLVAVCEGGPQTLTELSARTGLTPPTLLRTLRLIRDEGFVDQDRDRKWQATMLIWRLGLAVNRSTTPTAAADKTLSELTESIQETSVYAVFEQGWLTYLSTAEPSKPVRTHIPLGGHYPALDTVTGHAVLAWLRKPDVEATIDHAGQQLQPRERQSLYRKLATVAAAGYATGTGDRWPGIWGAAAPVFSQRGTPVGAIGVSVPAEEPPANAAVIVREVSAAAGRLTQLLGGDGRLPKSPLLH